ncbi:MAG: V-type ATPase subunit [Candidatus Margulisbacteria bacterium]|nr:V-type ATPase subunit [Candidatus Margulisiibacteriota bacterium]
MQEYFYGTGRIRALEARMLSAAQITRMAAAPDFKSAYAVLMESAYAEHLSHLKQPFNFEELAELELLALKDLMDFIAPGNEVIRVLFKKYDYLNLKILFRAFYNGQKEIEHYSRISTVSFEKLRLQVFEETKVIDDQDLLAAIAAAKEAYKAKGGFRALDLALNEHYSALLKTLPLLRLEKAKYMIGGIEPLAGFLLAKENETKTIRFILICKKNNVDRASIESYV